MTETAGAVLVKEKKSVSLLGLLNRVSEGNLDSISLEIIGLLSKNKLKPGDVASAILDVACENPNISVTLQGTFAAIACAIAVETAPSNYYSGGILAEVIRRLKEASIDESKSRVVTNLVRFSAALFSLGLFSAEAIDAILKFVSEPTAVTPERRLEWILTCLRFSGRVMRDLHKNRFVTILDHVIERVSTFNSQGKQLEFAIAELKLMKEGKSSFRAVDHLQTVAEWLVVRNASGKVKTSEGSILSGWKVPKSVEAVQLAVPTVSLFAYKFPKEWTASSGSASIDFETTESQPNQPHQPTLEELAAMNRMTTEVKKNAFVALMGSIDAKHALLRLDQFGVLELKHVPSVVAVVCHCALQEQKVNKFYLDVIKSLCCESREAKLKRKFAISFKIEFSKLISSGRLSETEVAVLSNLIAFYIQTSNGEVTMQDILANPRGSAPDDSS
jgi:hypothetical protein